MDPGGGTGLCEPDLHVFAKLFEDQSRPLQVRQSSREVSQSTLNTTASRGDRRVGDMKDLVVQHDRVGPFGVSGGSKARRLQDPICSKSLIVCPCNPPNN